MLKVILKILLLCFLSTTLYGQNDSMKAAAIDRYVYQINTSPMKVDSFRFIIDSIIVEGVKYGNTIVTKSLFKESKTSLTTTYFLKDKKMIFAQIVEPCTIKGLEKMFKYCAFYFENNKVIFERCRSTRQIGLAIILDGNNSNIYRYNENLTFDFLKNYVAILYNKL